MLKIDRSSNGRIVFTLSGRIEVEDIKQLQQLLASEASGKQLVLNLRDVTLVNQDAVEFLARCEADSITLENCPPYVRDWIGREHARPRRKKQNARTDKLQKGEQGNELQSSYLSSGVRRPKS